MADARLQHHWSLMSSVMALLANCHRDPKKRQAYAPRDFDPFSQNAAPLQVGVDVLKDVFIHGKVPSDLKQGG